MYLKQQKALSSRLAAVLNDLYQIRLETLAIEQPPETAFGEYALPVAFELARRLRKAPRKIAEEVVAALGAVPGFAGFEVAGAGYVNARLDRGGAVREIAARISDAAYVDAADVDAANVDAPNGDAADAANGEARSEPVHALVEHTSINPNKAAHVGHLRNAILGDTFVRLLRAAGQTVDVQNYIDNTGVQVADIVVGLTQLEGLTLSGVKELMARLAAEGERIDYYCWDLYAKTSGWYEADEGAKTERKKIRLETLHAIEQGGNDTAAIAELVSTAVLRRHLETMLRLDIEYDFLPRESEILRLHFWDLAFEQMKAKGVLYFESEGKNKGCWVMKRPSSSAVLRETSDGSRASVGAKGEGIAATVSADIVSADMANDPNEVSSGPDEDAKVIVRSNGTVTYVGKDIAYHLWKFGVLGRDFGYLPFFAYPDRRECWISAEIGEQQHPHFGGAQAIYNVIDSRQADPQANVIEALRGLGYTEQAAHYTHFSYEMVALTPRCALELGYAVAGEDRGRPYIEVSGRKGFGVKADDLIDKLIAATQAEVDARHPELGGDERSGIARDIAVGALRYFMLKYTRGSVIAFDFKDALSFEGETGPYLQYAVVRTRSIFRKAETTPEAALAAVSSIDAAPYLAGDEADAIWQVWLRAAKTSLLLEQCIATAEPAYLARHAFQLAQDFSNFYRRHHILTEADPARRTLLLATAAVAQRELVRALGWLGIAAPEVM